MKARPLRVASFTYSTKPRGGVSHTLSLAEHLQQLGHEVHVFALGKQESGFFRPTSATYTLIPAEAGAEDESLDARVLRYIQTYYQYLRQHPADAFDIYHSQDCISANALWRLREDGYIPSFVRTIHHIDDFVSPALIKCQSDSLNRPDHRIVVSRTWQRTLKETYGLDSEVIYNGVDLERFGIATPDQKTAARTTLHLQDQLIFLSIGGIEPRKNAIRLLKAFVKVKQTLEELGLAAVLLFVGGETLLDYTDYREAFFRLLVDLPLTLDKDVFMIGVVDDDMIPKLYHAADVLTFPSVKEGWGLVVLEALASGLPVLSSDLPVFHEYLKDGVNALLIDPFSEAAIADGMLKLVSDPALRAKLAQGGLVTAEAFSWRQTAAAHAAFYADRLSVLEA